MSESFPMWMRRASLLLVEGEKALEMGEFRFTFETKQTDVQSPSNCAVRVYNLKPETMQRVRGEFSRVVLQAGYQNGAFGVIFDGTIKQHGIGKEGPMDTYLDILAADGDLAHNFGHVNLTLASGSSSTERIAAVANQLKDKGARLGYVGLETTGGILPRGKVLFGMARAALNSETRTMGATWNISGGQINVIPLDGYLPSEAVVLTSETGLIGRAQQTQNGVVFKCLLNPRIQPGTLVKLDEASVNRISNTGANPAGIPYNQWAAPQFLANVTADGIYRAVVVEHRGDSRGQDWYTEVTGLAVNQSTNKVKPYG